MGSHTTVLCYMNGEIIDRPNGVCYSCPPKKAILISNIKTYDELETNICHALSIDRTCIKLRMIFRYPICVANGSINYEQVPIGDDGDVRVMFNAVTQSSPRSTIEMYLETSPRDHQSVSISYTRPMHVEVAGPSMQMKEENTSPLGSNSATSPRIVHSYDDNVELKIGMNLKTVTNSVMMAAKNFVDIPAGNDDADVKLFDEDEDNEDDEDNVDTDSPTKEVTSLGGEHEVSSLMSKELNWDAINARCAKTLTTCSGLWSESNDLFKGLRFKSKADLQYAVKRYLIHKNQQMIVTESEPNLWAVKCRKWNEGCKWRLRACRLKTHDMFEITKYTNSHTCVYPKLSEDHSQLDSTLIAREIQNVVQRDPNISIAALHQIVKGKFGYDVHYRKVWEARKKAIERVFGDWDESYHLLPKWMNILKITNPGTKVDWKTSTIGGSHDNVRLIRVFWAFGASIEGFKHCRPLIQIDAIFLYGKYKGKLLIATSMDANDNIFPLAFAIVEEESVDSWSWFLTAIRTHVTQREGICLISNCHVGIDEAVKDPRVGWNPPHAHHRYCLRHVANNFYEKYKNKVLKDLVYKAGCQHQSRKFQRCMEELNQLEDKCVGWFAKLDMKKWTQAYDEGYRYGLMTTNVDECINKVLKGAQMLPITAVVQMIFYHCVDYYEIRRAEIQAQIVNGGKYTAHAINKVANYEAKASGHMVAIFDKRNEVFEVSTNVHGSHINKGKNKQIVKLKEGTCTCNKWQSFGIPCSHVLAVCTYAKIDGWELVDKYYKLDAYESCYTPQFNPIPHEAYWPTFDFPVVHSNPTLLRRKGRPRLSTIRNEIGQRESSGKIWCGICKQEGHNRRKCPTKAKR